MNKALIAMGHLGILSHPINQTTEFTVDASRGPKLFLWFANIW